MVLSPAVNFEQSEIQQEQKEEEKLKISNQFYCKRHESSWNELLRLFIGLIK